MHMLPVRHSRETTFDLLLFLFPLTQGYILHSVSKICFMTRAAKPLSKKKLLSSGNPKKWIILSTLKTPGRNHTIDVVLLNAGPRKLKTNSRDGFKGRLIHSVQSEVKTQQNDGCLN